MSKKSEDHANYEFTMWLVERWEVMNLQLTQLAVTFIGFLGIELAIFAQVDPNKIDFFPCARQLGALAILALLVAITLFLWVIISDKFLIPGSARLRDFVANEPRKGMTMAEYFLLTDGIADEDLFVSLEQENRNLNRTYMPGIYVSGFGQLLIGILLIGSWISI